MVFIGLSHFWFPPPPYFLPSSLWRCHSDVPPSSHYRVPRSLLLSSHINFRLAFFLIYYHAHLLISFHAHVLISFTNYVSSLQHLFCSFTRIVTSFVLLGCVHLPPFLIGSFDLAALIDFRFTSFVLPFFCLIALSFRCISFFSLSRISMLAALQPH